MSFLMEGAEEGMPSEIAIETKTWVLDQEKLDVYQISNVNQDGTQVEISGTGTGTHTGTIWTCG